MRWRKNLVLHPKILSLPLQGVRSIKSSRAVAAVRVHPPDQQALPVEPRSWSCARCTYGRSPSLNSPLVSASPPSSQQEESDPRPRKSWNKLCRCIVTG